MKTVVRIRRRASLMVALTIVVTIVSTRLRADSGTCGGATSTLPFNDVGSSIFFCQIAEAYFSGLTNGTSATTYSPSSPVTREQMAAFITRTMDQSLKRDSRRVVLDQPWTTQPAFNPGTTPLADSPTFVQSDGEDLWVVVSNNTVSRIHASDGKFLGTWTGATGASNPLVAMGLVFVSGNTAPGALYLIDPSQPARAVATVTTTNPIGDSPTGLAFDGARIWTANSGGSVSIITPGAGLPWSCSPPSATGFAQVSGILFDGSNIWVTGGPSLGLGGIKKLDQNGGPILTTPSGQGAGNPVFDGTNIWVPNQGSNSVTVVRASTGAVLATLTGNGLNAPVTAAFDGERVLVTNAFGDSVSLWKATDLTPLGTFSTGANSHPLGACSDGLNFWLTMVNANSLARY